MTPMTGPAKERARKMFQSTLPFFNADVVEFGEKVFTRFTCPRSGCDGTFLVDGPLPNPTAPCVSCFRVARLQDDDEGALF